MVNSGLKVMRKNPYYYYEEYQLSFEKNTYFKELFYSKKISFSPHKRIAHLSWLPWDPVLKVKLENTLAQIRHCVILASYSCCLPTGYKLHRLKLGAWRGLTINYKRKTALNKCLKTISNHRLVYHSSVRVSPIRPSDSRSARMSAVKLLQNHREGPRFCWQLLNEANHTASN